MVEKAKKEHTLLKVISLIFFCLIIAICSVIIFFNFTHTYHDVVGPSMQPTLNMTTTDAVFVSKIKSWGRGDIIVANRNYGIEGGSEKLVIKRVIALSGDKIKVELIEDEYKIVLIKAGSDQSEVLNEPYLLGDYSTNASLFNKFNKMVKEQALVLDQDGFLLIEEGKLFYLGDNRAEGCIDCSNYGPMPKEAVRGKVDYIIYGQKNVVGQIIKQFFGWGKWELNS